MTTALSVRNSYSFEVYPATILGTNFKAFTVMSIMDSDSAKANGVDISALHAKVFPYLPVGTPNDPTAYDYVKFRTPNGQTVILGYPWIKEATIVPVESSTITVVITNALSTDIGRIRDALVQIGLNNLSIKPS